MIQWVSVLIALLGFAYNSVKDYQHGEIKIPILEEKKELTKPVYPIQYCVMAYDPNLDKVFYLHDNGTWYDFPPQIRKYQNQNQETLGNVYGASPGSQRYHYGQSPQATPYPQGY